MTDRRKMSIIDRIEHRLAEICAAVPPIDPPALRWLSSDATASYCKRCSITARGAEFDLGCPVVARPSLYWNDWEHEFYEGIQLGFDTTSDICESCETCGVTLSYILTDTGVDEELAAWRESPARALDGELSYALDRLCLNLFDGDARRRVLDTAIVVGHAWRLRNIDA